MNKEQLATELQDTHSQLEQVVVSLPEEVLNEVPNPHSWTPGQVVRHIIISNSGFLEVINGPAKPADRPCDAGVEKLSAMLLNFDNRLQAPEMVVPPLITYEKDRLLASLAKIKHSLSETFELDLTLLCTAFEMPRLGFFTRWEALHFILFHSQRHLRQLRNIVNQLTEKPLQAGY